MKTHKDPVSVAFDLDDIQYRLHGAIHLVLHSYYGMTASGCEPDESDFDALYSLFRYLESLDKELSASIDELTDTIYATRKSLHRRIHEGSKQRGERTRNHLPGLCPGWERWI